MSSTTIAPDASPTIPSTHQTSFVGGVPFAKYEAETIPITRSANLQELSVYGADPTKAVGRIFLPLNGENSWEVLEVTFSKKGWSSMTVQFEGSEKHHKMAFDDFVAMLKSGSLQVVEFE